MLRMTLILLLVCATSGDPSVFSVQQYSTVVAELTLTFHTKCVFLVTSDKFSVFSKVEIGKSLSKLGVAAASVEIETLNQQLKSFRCHENRPLFVTTGDNATHGSFQLLRKVPSHPRWLLFSDTTFNLDFFLYDVNIPFDCEFLVASIRRGEVVLTEIFRVAQSQPITRAHYGVWSPTSGLSTVRGSLYERRNLQGLVLRASVLSTPPVITLVKDENNNVINIEGFNAVVWRILEQRANFTTQLIEVVDGMYGTQDENGSWNGMIAMIVNNEVDICLNELSILNERFDVVDFLMPLFRERLVMHIRKPTKVMYKWDSILAPFSPRLWFSIVVCLAVLSVILKVTRVVVHRYGDELFEDSPLLDSQHSFFEIFTIFCMQGPNMMDQAASCRSLYIIAGLVSIVFVAGYSGALTSFMAVQNIQLPFHGAQGFLKDGTFELNITLWTALSHFKTSSLPIYIKIFETYMDPKLETLVKSNELGLEWLCSEERRVFLTLVMYTSHAPCSTVALPHELMTDTMSYVTAKNSPYSNILNHYLRQLRDSGVIEHLRLLSWPKPLSYEEDAFPQVSFDQVIGIVGLVLFGIIIGLIMLGIELAVAG